MTKKLLPTMILAFFIISNFLFLTASPQSNSSNLNLKKDSILFKKGYIGKLTGKKIGKYSELTITGKGWKIHSFKETKEMYNYKNLKEFKIDGKLHIKKDGEYYHIINNKKELITLPKAKDVGYCVKCRSKRDFKNGNSRGELKLKNGKTYTKTGIYFKKYNLELIKIKGYNALIVTENKKMSKANNIKKFKQNNKYFIKLESEYYEIVQEPIGKDVGYCVKCRSKRDFNGLSGKLKSGKEFKLTGKAFKRLKLEVITIKGYKPPVVIEKENMIKQMNLNRFKQGNNEFIKIEGEYYYIIQIDTIKDVGYCVKCRSKRD